MVGANLPDVDAIFYFTGHDDFARHFRRGWTHGVLALVVLPLVLTALLMLYARLRPDDARPVRPRWLLLLSALAILTHPALDWLNTYGMRWLMPFRGTWFYGDAVYIMDPWLWLILGCGWLAGRRPTIPLFLAWLFFVAAIVRVVGRRSPEYLPVVAVVAVVLLLALFWRPGVAPAPRRSIAAAALVLAALYIGARLTLSAATAAAVRKELVTAAPHTLRIMTGPHPLDPTRWDVVAQAGEVYRYGRYSWRDRTLRLEPLRIPVAKPSPEWTAARNDPSIRGYVGWIRFPWYEVERTPRGTIVHVNDARSAPRRLRSGTSVLVAP